MASVLSTAPSGQLPNVNFNSDSNVNSSPVTASAAGVASPPAADQSLPRAPRPKVEVDNDEVKAEIVRQVDHYFSDINLRTDEHLLGCIKADPDGEGKVSIREILGFPRMRKYKPKSAVIAALKTSEVLEIVNNKYIKRKSPFDMAKATVVPQINYNELAQRKKDILAGAPGLPKKMLDLTGFEHTHKEPELAKEDIEKNLQQYSRDNPLWLRVETVILNFRTKRKFHQGTAHLFDAFLKYGGIESRERAFTGGQDDAEEDLTKKEIALRRQTYFVTEEINDSIDSQDGKWVVDFEGTVKGFLSTRFPAKFHWCGEGEDSSGTVKAACNVLRNFFNYILHQNAFPEFTSQIVKARAVVDLAEKEFPVMAKGKLPGAFGTACSCVMDGSKAGIRVTSIKEWMTEEQAEHSQIGYSDNDATWIIMAGLGAWYPEKALQAKAAMASARAGGNTVATEKEVGLEVVSIMHAYEGSDDAKEIFKRCEGTVIPPMGKLICKRFHFPQSGEQELLLDAPPGYNNFEFLMDEETLSHCFIGMKIDAVVKKLDFGIAWIDHVYKIYGTFFEWCWNEEFGRLKKETKLAWYEKWKRAEGEENAVPEQEDALDGYDSDNEF